MEPKSDKSEQAHVERAPPKDQEASSAKRLGEGEHPLESETAKEDKSINSKEE